MDSTTDVALNRAIEAAQKFYSDSFSDLLVIISVVFVIIGLVFVAFPIVITMMQNRNFDHAIKSKVDNSEGRLKKNIEGGKEGLLVEMRKIRRDQENLKKEIQEEAAIEFQ